MLGLTLLPFLLDLAQKFWVGLVKVNGNWQYEDGRSEIDPYTGSPWSHMDPWGSIEDCATAYYGPAHGIWYYFVDENCGSTTGFICQKY